ncbi:hypothetical protein PG999_013403 [Apiospora kogelbergensis]|uniref:Uncharacterized protein n=1 Tax=Apiospora kogelbergensis TaxID=1337665 RepID=A0AAW0Q5W7_9PEZI
MPIRNPFATLVTRRPGNDENIRPEQLLPPDKDAAHPGFERVDTVGSKASSALSIRSAKSHDNGDYKMSVVNDSGVYLPPSPSEEKGLWPRRPAVQSRASMDTEDISARSPVIVHDPPRQSLDSSRFPRMPRSAMRDRFFDPEPPTAEEGFEEVGLNDEQKQQSQQPARKRGFFSKFSDATETNAHSHTQGMSRFIPGRKRAQSGQGAELGNMERPKSSHSQEGEEMQ